MDDQREYEAIDVAIGTWARDDFSEWRTGKPLQRPDGSFVRFYCSALAKLAEAKKEP